TRFSRDWSSDVCSSDFQQFRSLPHHQNQSDNPSDRQGHQASGGPDENQNQPDEQFSDKPKKISHSHFQPTPYIARHISLLIQSPRLPIPPPSVSPSLSVHLQSASTAPTPPATPPSSRPLPVGGVCWPAGSRRPPIWLRWV